MAARNHESSFNQKGLIYGLLGAAMYASYILIDKFVYKHYAVNNFNYAATFTIWAGIFGLGAVLVNRYKNEFKIINKGTVPVSLNGILAAIGIALIVYGQQYTTAINASIIATTSILTTVIYSRLILKESLSRLQSIWLAIMFIGLYIAIVGLGTIKLNKGDIIILGSALILGFTNTFSKVLMKNNTSDYVADFRLVAGGLLFVVLGLAIKGSGFFVMNAGLWPVVAGLCYWLTIKFFYASIHYSNPNEAIVLINSHPAITPIVGVLLLSESYSWTKLIGSVLILSGVYFINRKT
ncbi:MAG: DMT family transporter [Candidatus Saccharimonadales bacterium]